MDQAFVDALDNDTEALRGVGLYCPLSYKLEQLAA